MSIPQSASARSKAAMTCSSPVAGLRRPPIGASARHEKFRLRPQTQTAGAYEGKPGIHQLLDGMQRFGWQPVLRGRKHHRPMERGSDGASLSLEPAAVRTLRRAAQVRC